MDNLPALEQIEEAVKSMASMCSMFYNQLIAANIPRDVAKSMAVQFTSEVGKMMKPNQGDGL